MSDFDSFKNAFKGDLVTPSDPDYSQAIYRWALNACRNAAIVAFVKDPEDVALAISYSRKAGLPIAIRCGGHSPAGASSSENGLVIDLSRYLNKVRVDVEAKLAYAGGGTLQGTIDQATIEHGLATPGGTVHHVCDYLFGCELLISDVIARLELQGKAPKAPSHYSITPLILIIWSALFSEVATDG